MTLVSQNPGRMDRRLTLLYEFVSRDSAGGEVKEWIEAGTVWGSWLPQGGSEFQAAQAQHAEATGIFRIRHRTDVTDKWRVRQGDDVFDIIVPMEVGRRDYLDLVVNALDQSTGSALSVEMLHDATPAVLEDGSPQLMHAA